MRLRNKLPEPTTLSFPGLRAANASAGIGGLTQPPIAPGASLDIRFSPPDAGFNLYFPHAGAASGAQISSGLFGPIVVEEPSPPAVDLETIVVLSDWRLDPSGQIADLGQADLGRGAGRIGAALTANSAPAPLPSTAAPGARVRLRLANAATARVMGIAIEGAKASIVAVDGQPSEAFEPLARSRADGAGRALRTDVRHAARSRRAGAFRAARRRFGGGSGRARPADDRLRGEGRSGRGASANRRAARQSAASRRRSASNAPSAST